MIRRVCMMALAVWFLGTAAAETADEPTDVLVSEAELAAALAAPEEPKAPPLTLAAGTRLRVRLLSAASVTDTPGPIAAELLDDIVRDDRVVIPRGTRFSGRAFTTGRDDRAQVAFRSWVVAGRTIRLEGMVIGDDGEPGMRGKARHTARSGDTHGVEAVVRLERLAIADVYLQRDVVVVP